MAKGAMNKNLSNNPTKLSTRGGKRFRCDKNYATQQQELVAIMPPPGMHKGGTPFRRVTNATQQ
jgi:hypothetical protein